MVLHHHYPWEVTHIENNRNRQTISLIFLLVYIFTVLWFTVLKRSSGYHVAQFELFWSYKRWFAGDTDLGNEIMANIAMFIPFGFLVSSVLPTLNRIREKRKARGWSQNDLAEYLGSDYRVVSRHENGHGMNLESLVRYSRVFNCPITSLLPMKFRQNISPQLIDVLVAVAVLPEEKQNTIAAMIRMAINLAA